MITYEKLSRCPSAFKSMTAFSVEAFDTLLLAFARAHDERLRRPFGAFSAFSAGFTARRRHPYQVSVRGQSDERVARLSVAAGRCGRRAVRRVASTTTRAGGRLPPALLAARRRGGQAGHQPRAGWERRRGALRREWEAFLGPF